MKNRIAIGIYKILVEKSIDNVFKSLGLDCGDGGGREQKYITLVEDESVVSSGYDFTALLEPQGRYTQSLLHH